MKVSRIFAISFCLTPSSSRDSMRSRPARPRWTNDFFIQLHFTGVAFQKLIFINSPMDSEERINMIGKDSKIQIFKQYIEKK